MKMLSKTTVYGIRAALYVASMVGHEKYVPIHEISSELGISFHFLTKILRSFTEHNIMVSYRGPNGGVALARPARDITVMDLISAVETDHYFDGCILGLADCGEDIPCPLHAEWKGTRERIKSVFDDSNLAELARRINDEGLRLAM